MNTTRRQFFTRLLGAAAAVPVLLTGNPTRAAQTGALDQDLVGDIEGIDRILERWRREMANPVPAEPPNLTSAQERPS